VAAGHVNAGTTGKNAERLMNCLLRRLRAAFAISLSAASLLACTARIETQGYIPDEELVAQIQIGVDGPRDVAEVLGTPPSETPFSVDNTRTWYYIMRRTKRESFFDEEVLDQRVLAVEFDESGYVSGFRRYELADGQLVEPVDRVTPTRGRRLGFFEQIFGNVGRFGTGGGGEP
jgi:outer membrane protein assembly factor BamE (lipoprotein component of BamABCDE complex)